MKAKSTLKFLLQSIQQQQIAIPYLFFLLGMIYASWAARIPSIHHNLQLEALTLSMVLLCGGVGAVTSFPLAAWLNIRYGARRASWYTGIALLFLLPILGFVSKKTTLMFLSLCYGSASSCFDVAINVLGAAAEKRAKRSIMSLLHAWFCVGTFCGALIGSGLATFKIMPGWHFLLLSLISLLPLRLACKTLPNDPLISNTDQKFFVIPHNYLITLGLIGFCSAIIEGSIADWSGLYLKNHMHASDGIAPLAYASFTGMMLIARLTGDRMKERWGAQKVIGYSSLLASSGIFIAIIASKISLAIIGFAIAGSGVAMVFPFVFSAAGKYGPTALASVATLGYSGSLIGPPIVGMLAHIWDLQAALVLISILCATVAFAASRIPWPK